MGVIEARERALPLVGDRAFEAKYGKTTVFSISIFQEELLPLLFKMRRIFAALLFVLTLPSLPAWALEPQDALAARPEESFYMTLRVNDLGRTFRDFLSPANIELLASLVDPPDAQIFRLVGSYASRIPAKSVALAAGATAEGPFIQIAAAMPENLQPQLSLVAEGKAAAADLTALVLGDDSPLFSLADVAVRQGKHGPYYAPEGKPFTISAKGNLLLLAFSPEDLDSSKEALETADKRLNFKRRFKSPNYVAFHIDVPTTQKIAAENGNGIKTDAALKFFKAPMKAELAFDAKPGKFLISCAMNALEALSTTERLSDLKPVKGGGLFFAGDGKPYCGLAALFDFNPEEDLLFFPELSTVWNSLCAQLEREGISPDDVKNLLKGSVSLVASGNAKVLGQSIPGVSVAFTGRQGAAGNILRKLLENEKFTSSVPLSPLKTKGWDTLFQVDPSLFPLPVLVGVKGETLFLGILDPNGMDKKPNFSPRIAEFVEQDSFATGFLDVPALWERLRRALLDAKSFFGKEFDGYSFAKDILEGEPPVNLIKAWTPSVETSFLEFQTAEVAAGKSVLPRLVDALKAALPRGGANENYEDYEGAPPLLLLMVAKEAIEEALAENPGASLDDLREDLSDFAVILGTESGDIYVGTRVAGDEKPLLREQAGQFGLLGSAGLTLAPDGTPYDGQEAVWLKINR
jgi:hypothetical protein